MNIKKIIKKVKKRFKLFKGVINQNNMFIIAERGVPAYFYLLYNEEEIIEWQQKSIRKVRELLNENNARGNNSKGK